MKQRGTLEVDALVLGSGPAGAATALALLRNGHSVAMIDRSDQARPRIGETLPPSVRPLLSDLGLWEDFLRAGHLPAAGVSSVWGGAETHDNDFIFNPFGRGWHIDRADFDLMLARAVVQRGGALVRTGPESRWSVERGRWGWECTIFRNTERTQIRAHYCVDGTGRRSAFACKHGAKRTVLDHLIGIIGFLAPCSEGASQNSFTLLESIEDGWWYSALLPNGHVVTAYMTDADLFARASRSPFWSHGLRQANYTTARLSAFKLRSSLFVVAANTALLSESAGPDWLAVGDAAASFDPLSSQGISKALESGIRAAQAISESLSGRSLGLREYAEWVYQAFDRYLYAHAHYYSLERRWPDSAFWRRRQPSLFSGGLRRRRTAIRSPESIARAPGEP